ncbi:MAG: hypothetical protein J7K17_05190, partial [Candidatus Omnitrophica bacterium]|nr:hypothetical protein [Candidatus Omnitrophota bacterium]
LNISFLKQIASFLREGRLSEENVWYKIATDNGNSRLGFILDVSGSDLKAYLSKIKSHIENKKAVIFIGMGGSINTVKIMRKFSQGKEIIFIDTPDKIMIEGLIEELQDKGVSLKEIEVIAISKSATTFETHTIVNILKEIYTQNNLSFTQNLIWLIDLPNKDKLEEKGYDLDKLTIFPIQIDNETDIGGRYTAPKTSLFILPLFILLGCDIKETIEVLDYIKKLEDTKSFENNINDYIDLVVSKDKINPCVYLILPDEFESIYEEVTVWITQLYQESLGGKVDEFDPKILVLLENQINPALKENLQKQGLVGLDFRFLKEEDLIKKFISLSLYLEYIVLGIAYKYSSLNKKPLNFVTQPNVDEYKRIMKEIKELKEPQQIDLSSLTSFIGNNLGENQKFVEIVYYGTDENIYDELKSMKINERFVLVFRGPDWNHHSFQAAYKAKHTLFVLLLDKNADENVKRIAYATSKALSETLEKSLLYRSIKSDGGKEWILLDINKMVSDWVSLGSGGEAVVYKGEITQFEFEEKIIKLRKPLLVCKRESRSKDFKAFYRHLVCKLLDECFLKKKFYSTSHIPTPLGWYEQGYFYIYAEGTEFFPWQDSCVSQVVLKEWKEAVGEFLKAGIDIAEDISDADWGYVAKNIILKDYDYSDFLSSDGYLPKEWKRIDFGYVSLGIYLNLEKLNNFLLRDKEDLKKRLSWKFRLLELAVVRLSRELVSEKEEFEYLFAKYQQEVLRQYAEKDKENLKDGGKILLQVALDVEDIEKAKEINVVCGATSDSVIEEAIKERERLKEVSNNEISLTKVIRLNRLAQADTTFGGIEVLKHLATRAPPKKLLS